jgi:hypothetical protein
MLATGPGKSFHCFMLRWRRLVLALPQLWPLLVVAATATFPTSGGAVCLHDSHCAGMTADTGQTAAEVEASMKPCEPHLTIQSPRDGAMYVLGPIPLEYTLEVSGHEQCNPKDYQVLICVRVGPAWAGSWPLLVPSCGPSCARSWPFHCRACMFCRCVCCGGTRCLLQFMGGPLAQL